MDTEDINSIAADEPVEGTPLSYSRYVNIFLLASVINAIFIFLRLSQFKASLQQMFRQQRSQSLSLPHIQQNINTHTTGQHFTPQEVTGALNQMTEENQVMLADGIVFLI